MMNILSDKPVNTSRQLELDLAKGLAILFMVWVHVNENYQSPLYEGGIYNRFIEFIGSPPAAPVFMFLLGAGIIYSKKSTPKYLLKRGIFMIILAYVLNFFRDFIPFSLLAIKASDPSYNVDAVTNLFGIDILPFAGLSFIFFSIIKKFKIQISKLPLIYLILATLNLFLRNKSTGSYATDAFFGLFWGTNDFSWFPFLSWIFYPILGYIFAHILIHTKNKRALYKTCGIYSFIALIPLTIYAYINNVHFGAFGELYQETYYHHDIIGNIIMGTFTIFWLSLIFFISLHINKKVLAIFSRWSKNVNLIYCTHWIFLGYSMLIFELETLGPVQIFILAVILFIISDLISFEISKFRTKQKSNLKIANNKMAS